MRSTASCGLCKAACSDPPLPEFYRDRGARSVRIRFQAARGGYQLRSYRVGPENVPLPAAPTEQLRSLARAAINESLRRPHCRGKTGDLTWTVESDRMEIRY